MRISDWSSDVCSSDLDWLEIEWRESGVEIAPEPNRRKGFGTELITRRVPYELKGRGELKLNASGILCVIAFPLKLGESVLQTDLRSEERRVGKEGGRTLRSRWSPYH